MSYKGGRFKFRGYEIARQAWVFLGCWLGLCVSAWGQLGPADPSFKPRIDAPGAVLALVPLDNGDVLMGGSFRTVNDHERHGIARLGPNGNPDPAFAPDINGTVNAMVVQPDGSVVAVGSFAAINGVFQRNIVRLTRNGSVDTTFAPFIDFEIKTIALQVFSSNDLRFVVGGVFSSVNGRTVNGIARLRRDGSLDEDFRTGVGVDRSFEEVLSVAAVPDGRIYVAGDFTAFDGKVRKHLVRLRADGSLDNSFDLQAGPNDRVTQVLPTSGNRVLVIGGFSSINGIPRERLARLLDDGSVDPTFRAAFPDEPFLWDASAVAVRPDGRVVLAGHLGALGTSILPSVIGLDSSGRADEDFPVARTGRPGGGDLAVHTLAALPSGDVLVGGRFGSLNLHPCESVALLESSGVVAKTFVAHAREDGWIVSILPQEDGRIIIAGRFSRVNGIPRRSVARLNHDGSLDQSFDPGEGVFGSIWSGVLQADQRVLLGGWFGEVDGVARTNLVRLNLNGSVDEGFVAGADWVVRALAVQTNGQIVVGGEFFRMNGHLSPGVARLWPNGSIDQSFNADGLDYSSVFAIAVQKDQALIIGGNFSDSRVPPRQYLARLRPDGSLDESFDPGTGLDSIVVTLALDQQERILVGGWFQTIDGHVRRGLARLLPSGALDPSFDPGQVIYSQPVYFAEAGDGRILFGGDLYTSISDGRLGVGRLTEDGRLDSDFGMPSSDVVFVGAMAREPDGGILVRYQRYRVDGSITFQLARLWPEPRSAFALSQPRLTGPGRMAFDLEAEGPAPESVAIEWSSDLVHWNVLTTVKPGTRPVPVLDDQASGAHRFYRVAVQ